MCIRDRTEKVPLVIEILDESEKIEKFIEIILPIFDNLNKGCMITVEKATIILHKKGAKDKQQKPHARELSRKGINVIKIIAFFIIRIQREVFFINLKCVCKGKKLLVFSFQANFSRTQCDQFPNYLRELLHQLNFKLILKVVFLELYVVNLRHKYE
eukprot:TRINITY_DN37154_c0_g1_i1.p1 TRINITY_DN37154_c0_g1~~TRINITY_DN37154_c0_g1_i1.p1  ORF type:complete len:174 (+),score=10.74 TRINITY_DN37154_c0_g1_i1:52-522(+)